MSIPLGKSVPQPLKYSPQSLSGISRSLGRKNLSAKMLDEMTGYDVWTFWECNWLNHNGMPQHAVVQMSVLADSPNIVESKSLKLYLNSFNNSCIGEKEDLLQCIEKDLTLILGVRPMLKILQEKDLQRKNLAGECIDAHAQQIQKLLPYQQRLEELQKQSLSYQVNTPCVFYSQLFRSLCPVTAQPDFASSYVHHSSFDPKALLVYWLSFRNHQGFHEQCVESMFDDFSMCLQHKQCDTTKLVVGAAFTRRGGIDIHPIRYHRDNASFGEQPVYYTFVQ